MYFKNIYGHQAQKELCIQLVEKNKIPHAQIFFGPEGVGKLMFARALASYMLCENPSQEDSCGSCPACIKSHKMIHPDIHFTFPTIGTNVTSNQMINEWRTLLRENPFATYHDWLTSLGAENKQGNINKEECNQMIKTLGLKTFESSQKIWIIWGGEFLGNEGNRLLKIIEEPPEGTYIMIVINNLDHILGTIRSRCQSLKLNALSESEIVQNLEQWSESNHDAATLNKVGKLADGRMNEALKLSHNAVNPFEKLWISYITNAVKNDAYAVSTIVDDVAKLGKESQKLFVQYGLFFIRQVFIQKHVKAFNPPVMEDHAEVIEKLAQFWTSAAIEDITKELEELEMGISRNGNIKILLFDSYLQIMKASRRANTRKTKINS